MDTQHGKVKVELNGNIIEATLIGAFNDIGAEKYVECITYAISKLNDEKFAVLVDNTNMHGGTPEAYQILEAHNQWLINTNIVAKAIIVKTPITTHLITSLSPSIKRQNMKTFSNKESAVQWLYTILR